MSFEEQFPSLKNKYRRSVTSIGHPTRMMKIHQDTVMEHTRDVQRIKDAIINTRKELWNKKNVTDTEVDMALTKLLKELELEN